MSAAHEAGECRRFERWLTAYVDDELDAVHALEVEDHLEGCESCREYVTHLEATRISLQEVCAMRCPTGLRERIAESLQREGILDEESEPGDSLDASSVPMPRIGSTPAPVPQPSDEDRPSRLRYLVPLAAAATFALLVGATQLREAEAPTASSSPVPSGTAFASTIDGLVDDLVVQHANPPPPETTDPDGLQRFSPYIGVRVKKPEFDKVDARFAGARMMHRNAAMLQYILRDRSRVTVYVFDPKKVPLRPGRLERRNVDQREVLVGKVRGYSVAASEQDGIGYALASDLSGDEAAELAVMAAR